MTFYCTGSSVTSESDLEKIYFRVKDNPNDVYYTSSFNSRKTLPDTVTKCGSSSKVSIKGMDQISVPPNFVGYLYPTSFSTKYDQSIVGDYYHKNVVPTPSNPSPVPYNGEEILDLHVYPQNAFVANCNCSTRLLGGNVNGVTSSMCGGLYNLPASCVPGNEGALPASLPAPRPFKPDINANITGWIWGLIAVVAFIFVVAIIFGILILFGVFKSGEVALDAVSDSKSEQQPSSPRRQPIPGTVSTSSPRSPLGEGIN